MAVPKMSWQPYGSHMATIWQLYGNKMAAPKMSWQPYGSHMAGLKMRQKWFKIAKI